jgi:hypothetical protein
VTDVQPPDHDLLRQELYALASALRARDVPLVVGGGYGLLLWQRHVLESGAPTLRRVPPARSTEDLDVYLSAELIADAERVTALRDVLLERGYAGVEGALYYQFQREVDYFGQRRMVKVDLLAPLPKDEEARRTLKYDVRRVRPREARNIHAHTSPEALTVGEHPLAVEIDGDAGPVTVHVPHPYTYLVLKLHAYRDRREDEDADYGRYHAFDLYRTLAMTTEAEWDEAGSLRDRFEEAEPVREARRIAHDLFRDEVSPGALALHEGARQTGFDLLGLDALAFLNDLHELFPAPAASRLE